MSARELRAQRVQGAPRRTYACLEGRGRKPSDYEITTTSLLYYPPRGFEVETPVWRHHQAHQLGGKLSCADWDAFEDPRHTTYSSYVAARRDQEALLDHLFSAPPPAPSPGLAQLAQLVSALRFPLHGLQMVSSYVGALAPSGRIAVVAALQAADELRRIQRLCQWLARGATPLVELDRAGRALWQEHRALQPLRRVVERLLVTYSWEDALVGLNGVLKPALEPLLGERLGVAAARSGDELLGGCVRSFAADAAWHGACFERLELLLTEGNPENAELLSGMKQQLRPAVLEACEAALTLLPAAHGEGGARGDTV